MLGPFFERYLEVFTQVGFKVTDNTFVKARELFPNEGDCLKKPINTESDFM